MEGRKSFESSPFGMGHRNNAIPNLTFALRVKIAEDHGGEIHGFSRARLPTLTENKKRAGTNKRLVALYRPSTRGKHMQSSLRLGS